MQTTSRQTVLNLAATLSCLLICGGCESVQSVIDQMDKPTAKVEGVNISKLNVDAAELVFDVRISNPYPVALPLVNADYRLTSASKQLLAGKADIAGSIPAKGSEAVKLPVGVVFQDLLTAGKGVRLGDVVPYEALMTLSVDVPGGQRVNLPVRKEGELPVPAVPEVQLTNVDFQQLDLQSAKALLELSIKNTNQFPVDLTSMKYTLSLAGKQIVTTSAQQGVKFEPGKSAAVAIPVEFSPSSLGLAAFNVLRGKGASYRLNGNMELNTPYLPVSLPFDRSGSTTFSK